jgi:hypothetical protein
MTGAYRRRTRSWRIRGRVTSRSGLASWRSLEAHGCLGIFKHCGKSNPLLFEFLARGRSQAPRTSLLIVRSLAKGIFARRTETRLATSRGASLSRLSSLICKAS